MTRRDFTRVVTLSNIGIHAGEGGNAEVPFAIGWKKQTTFVTQCQDLASKARWWKILQQHKIDFDPRRFNDSASSGTSEAGIAKLDSRYVASLVPSLIYNSSRSLACTEALHLTTKFVTAFGLDSNLAAQKHVEYLLSPFITENSVERTMGTEMSGRSAFGHHQDIRHALILCERAAKHSISLLPSPMARSAVLRRCVIELEKAEGHGTDYERHSVILALYHAELSAVVAQGLPQKKTHLKAFKEELELIDCRQQALEILSSFFQGRLQEKRPNFPKFFIPLQVPFNPEKGKSKLRNIGILGVEFDKAGDTFDPLDPLMEYLSQNPDTKTAKTLAVLCPSLGVPKGYIHARALIERFNLAALKRISLPSFDDDVLPVITRIKSSRDKTKILEWAAAQYSDGDEKLKCLDHALECAMKASSEAEQRRCSGSQGDKILVEEEILALDSVKRISEAKSVLSDKLLVHRILRSRATVKAGQFRTSLMDELVKKLESKFKGGSSPETLVEFILCESSLLIASASLDEDTALPLSHVRCMASLIHQGCKALADQHSHVNAGQIARRIARRWLVHGDDVASEGPAVQPKYVSSITGAATNTSSDLYLSVAEEDDTVNFVMDLNSLGEGEQVWSDDVGSGSNSTTQHKKVTLEEEPSGLSISGSSREASECACRRVALRIAFVLSFAEGLFLSHQGDTGDNSIVKSININANSQHLYRTSKKKSRSGLLTSIATTSQQSISVVEHTRELLRIVFAKSGGSHWVSDLSQSFITTTEDSAKKESRRTITFAMRHRALRTAATLCPQEALDQVIREEGYLTTKNSEMECTLKDCSFGCFVAKEIEEMGLPLPHSDLIALSTMHFPSYARALWRHHGSAECNGYKGRLLLLLLEMSLKENITKDKSLVVSILNEMSKMQLPRSLLIGCESIARFKKRASISEFTSLVGKCDEVLSMVLTKIAKSILGELHKKVSDQSSSPPEHTALLTLRRLGQLVEKLGNEQDHLLPFVDVMLGIVACSSDEILSEGIATIAFSAIICLGDGDCRSKMLLKLSSSESGKRAIRESVSSIQLSDNNIPNKTDAPSLLEMAVRLTSTSVAHT